MADQLIKPRVLYSNVIGSDATTTINPGDGTVLGNALDWFDYSFFTCSASGEINVPAGAGKPELNHLAWYFVNDGASEYTLAVFVGLTQIAIYTGIGTTLPYLGLVELPTPTTPGAGDTVTVAITLTSGPGTGLRQITLGDALISPIPQKAGVNRASFAGANRYTQKISINGSFIGRDIIRQEKSQAIDWDYLSDDFLRDDWQPFALHAERKAFFYAWDLDRFPSEVSFASATSVSPPTNMSNPNCRAVKMPLHVLVEEYP